MKGTFPFMEEGFYQFLEYVNQINLYKYKKLIKETDKIRPDL